MARIRITNHGATRGVVSIEAALLFPLLLLLTFGVIEYGWVFLKSQQITNAARQGARIGARPDASNALVESTIASLMNDAGISGYQITMPGDITQIPPGTAFVVEISVPYASIELGGPPFVPMPDNLHASVSMAKEGP